jgi:hypothetical protein
MILILEVKKKKNKGTNKKKKIISQVEKVK